MGDDRPGWGGQHAAYDADQIAIQAFPGRAARAACSVALGRSVMNRLNPLDALFVDAEDKDRHTSMAIASIAVLEGPPPSHEEFLAGP